MINACGFCTLKEADGYVGSINTDRDMWIGVDMWVL